MHEFKSGILFVFILLQENFFLLSISIHFEMKSDFDLKNEPF